MCLNVLVVRELGLNVSWEGEWWVRAQRNGLVVSVGEQGQV